MPEPSSHQKTKSAEGLVLWALGHRARVLINGKQVTAIIPGRWKLISKSVRILAAGDRVIIHRSNAQWQLKEVLPRTNEFTRRFPGAKAIPQTIAANLDQIIIVAAANHPMTPFGFVDRLLIAARLGGISNIMLLVNKFDVAPPETIEKWSENYKFAVDSLLFSSCITGQGIDDLANTIRGKTVLMAGNSGVGKSTLVNIIDPNLDLKTGAISMKTDKGRHITSIAKLHPISLGGWITDTPGLRECSPWDMTPDMLGTAFPEIRRLLGDCHFRNCLHDSEADCPVKEMVGTDQFPTVRYNSYIKILQEAKEELLNNQW